MGSSAPSPARSRPARRSRADRAADGQFEFDFDDISSQIRRRNRRVEELTLGPHAATNEQARRRRPEPRDVMRTEYERDRHRIIFSRSYRGYRGRTQVFALSRYHLSDRMVHVQYVVQISRMIAKALELNTDLTEAIALGHDLGHAPFGHDGEEFLSQICQESGLGAFHHNIHSLRIVDCLERHGRGLNLTWQVRDGLVSHDGEVHSIQLRPQRDKTEEDLAAYIQARQAGLPSPMLPATLEGCVMRISDTVAYIGSDIEDAVRVGMVSVSELPEICRRRLGTTNGQIIETIVKDVIRNSLDQGFVCFSPEISDDLRKLKEWNYENIYLKFKRPHDAASRQWAREVGKMRDALRIMFETFVRDLEEGSEESPVYREFLSHMEPAYRDDPANSPAVVTRDFIASLTDADAQRLIIQITVPQPIFMDLPPPETD